MRIVLAALLCLVASLVQLAPALAAELDAVAAVNLAGRQRMLSQRIVKAYVQLGLGVMSEAAQNQLKDSVALFDQQLGRLRDHARDEQSGAAVARLEAAWRPLRALAMEPVARERAERLLALDGEVLRSADQLATLLQERAGGAVARLVNLAGRQRMLCQRAAKLYMLRAWGFDSLRIEDDMAQAMNEFADVLAQLQKVPQNTPHILRELDSVATQLEWFRSALELEGAYSYRLLVADSSESILAGMELVAQMYEDLGVSR